MKVHSLTHQTVTIVLIAQVLCALALGGAEVLHEGHSRLHAFDVRLQGRSDSLLGAIQDAEDPDSTVRVDPAELKLPDEDVFAVYAQAERSWAVPPMRRRRLLGAQGMDIAKFPSTVSAIACFNGKHFG